MQTAELLCPSVNVRLMESAWSNRIRQIPFESRGIRPLLTCTFIALPLLISAAVSCSPVAPDDDTPTPTSTLPATPEGDTPTPTSTLLEGPFAFQYQESAVTPEPVTRSLDLAAPSGEMYFVAEAGAAELTSTASVSEVQALESALEAADFLHLPAYYDPGCSHGIGYFGTLSFESTEHSTEWEQCSEAPESLFAVSTLMTELIHAHFTVLDHLSRYTFVYESFSTDASEPRSTLTIRPKYEYGFEAQYEAEGSMTTAPLSSEDGKALTLAIESANFSHLEPSYVLLGNAYVRGTLTGGHDGTSVVEWTTSGDLPPHLFELGELCEEIINTYFASTVDFKPRLPH